MKFNIERIREIADLVKEMAIGLVDLQFIHNFRGFEKEVTIPATSEAKIRNELDFIPARYIIMDQTGNGLVTRGSTPWDGNYLYLYNNGSVSVTITVQFLR